MKKVIYYSAIFSFALITVIVLHNPSSSQYNYTNYHQNITSYNNFPSEEKPFSSPDLEKYYFERWHEQYGNTLPQSEIDRIWDEINNTPGENDVTRSLTTWTCMGPYGMNYLGSSSKFTGRILDIEVTPSIRFASASGGLWRTSPSASPLSDAVTSLVIGSFDSKSGTPNTIFVGTGEPFVRSGTGLWRTTDGGVTWNNIPLSPQPLYFYKLRYDPVNTNLLHAATDQGYYKSTNGGSNWNRIYTGWACDIAINPNNPNIIYLPFWGFGLWKSTNGGTTFTQVTTPGIPTTNVGRSSVTICTSNPNVVYVSMVRNDNNQTLGVYKTINDGATWSTVTPNPNMHGSQGWYDNVVSVSPVNSNIVLAGGIDLWRSSNGGSSWTQLLDPDLHVDHHAIDWSSNGNTVYNGNDGGLSVSNDAGINWNSSLNTFPITQYYNIGIGVNNSAVIFGGSQDNGLSGTTNGGASWNITLGGDGSGISIDPNNSSRIFATDGVYPLPIFFRPLISTNTGQSWTLITSGLPSSTQWFTKIRNDYVSPVNIYTNTGAYVYKSTNYGSSWFALNTSAFPCTDISNITVSRNTSPSAVVYACLNNNPATSNKLMVYDNGTWYNRSSSFPSANNLRTVVPHQTDRNKAYALVNGLNTPGQKVYKTTNRGISWTNISGNLPDIPLGDLVPHPINDSVLYLGTEIGCYKTTTAGTTWIIWNNGMPKANIITEMSYIDSSSINGKYYIIAGSFGRSIWQRETEETVVNVSQVSNSLPTEFKLYSNYPNPFNPITHIEFDLPKTAHVKLIIYDLNGKQLTILSDERLNAGRYEKIWNGSGFSSGVYFYQIRVINEKGQKEDYVETKKMLLVK